MADWQEPLQATIIGLIFAYMVGRLFSLIAAFRSDNLRLERERDIDTALLSASETKELAPAVEHVPLPTFEEELDASGEDEAEDPGHESSTSDSEADEAPPIHSGDVEDTYYASLHTNTAEKQEEEVPVVEEAKSEIPKVKAEDRVTPFGEHSLKALTEPAGGDVAKEIEEGNETDDWEGVESTELEELFGAASTFAVSMVTLPGVKPSSEAMLQLYAFYKIATEGPCLTHQPSLLQPTARAKWNAWQKLGNLPQEEAMQRYIAVLTEINPTWHRNVQKNKEAGDEVSAQIGGGTSQSTTKMGPGPVFSSLAMSEEGVDEAGSMEAIHACAREGDLEGLNQLLDHGSPVDLTGAILGNLGGPECLQSASERDLSEKALSMLIRARREKILKGSDSSRTSPDYQGSGKQSPPEYLLDRPRNLSSSWSMFADSDGRTPLIWAADRGQLSAVEILVAKGAEIHAKDLEGQTALHYATVCEQETVAKFLLEHGADANMVDNDGTTPLKLCPPHWLWMQGTPS